MTSGEEILTRSAPQFSEDEIIALMSEAYAFSGATLRSLNSERDQVVLFGNEHRQLVVKLSNEAETQVNIDLEEAAALWAVATDPGLPLSTPFPVAGSAARHTIVRHPQTGTNHFVRAYERLPGSASLDGAVLSSDVVFAYGAVTARSARALRGFFHPAAARRLPWHIEERERTRALSMHILDQEVRDLVEAAFEDFEERVAPGWKSMRAQVVHGDLTLDNLLIEGEEVTGLLDLGDLTHSTLVFDIAAAFGSLSSTLEGGELFRTLRQFLDGYRSVTPLEPQELGALGDTIAVRAAITLCISSWRRAEHPENATYIEGWDEISLSLLRQFQQLGHEEVSRRLGGPTSPPDTDDLARRRRAVFGEALAPLTYSRPLHLVRGTGATLTDSMGNTYVDAYNNVPVVGHAHPRVTEAVADQARLLSTNLRYLHPRAIELVEKLADTLPPHLDTVLLVNSGSEATDLAWRLATAATGRTGALVTQFAYHGVTAATAAMSPEEWRGGWTADHVERYDSPRGPQPDATSLVDAVQRLHARGHEPALLIVDTMYTSDGILVPGTEYHDAIGSAARAAGALVVADEVQAGFGRAGDHLWSFMGAGLNPDIVTLGKPMGNGYPLAAVATRREYVDALGAQAEFFSTFAGSPVAAVAGLAVLEVIDDLDLVSHSDEMGALLRRRLREITAGCPAVQDIRGRGLLNGVDLEGVSAAEVAATMDRVKDDGVLIGSTGPRSDVLKIRPPLVISASEIERVAVAVGRSLMQTVDC